MARNPIIREASPQVPTTEETPHGCYDGWVFLGFETEDESGEQVEVIERVPCRRCQRSYNTEELRSWVAACPWTESICGAYVSAESWGGESCPIKQGSATRLWPTSRPASPSAPGPRSYTSWLEHWVSNLVASLTCGSTRACPLGGILTLKAPTLFCAISHRNTWARPVIMRHEADGRS